MQYSQLLPVVRAGALCGQLRYIGCDVGLCVQKSVQHPPPRVLDNLSKRQSLLLQGNVRLRPTANRTDDRAECTDDRSFLV